MGYGLPTGARINYGAKGFPAWVYQLAAAFGLQASTYPGHQETDRIEAGYARNPDHQNRGIDWTGPVDNMQRFADYLLTVKSALEQVIWQNPTTGRRTGVAGGRDVTTTAYFGSDYANHTDHVHTRQSAPIPMPGGTSVTLTDPFTGAVWSPSFYHPRGAGTPRWIAVHTQEGGRTARDLAAYLAVKANEVSYHVVNDERETLKVVAEVDAPWSAAGANKYAFHICLAGSYSAWSRGKWLETDASDGKNEDAELTAAAKVIAWWCQKYNIPAEYIGGNGIPWGRDGICGHMDFGAWGGGHHDPGPNFPWDELIRRVKAFLAGATPTPVDPTPVGPGGGTPVNPGTSQYFAGLLYIGSTGPQVSELQRRLKNAFASYAGHLPIDGDFGPLTDAAVREFQRRSGLVVDGIVGPQTAAALKLKKVA
ncbi:N-acetylmuramoyl-L-alanine amidase [Mycobacterium hackensackense]|uniref:peptidoglycan recognition protein family protein n=1 Tax=Mycobacterium hackensackense TaxID=228909 RepID=UPI003556C5E6|nr:N-acetylmuramoyl-L-alanine amidase [Mycobacterium hackensackense]